MSKIIPGYLVIANFLYLRFTLEMKEEQMSVSTMCLELISWPIENN